MADKSPNKVASVLLKDAGWEPVRAGSDLSVRLWRRPGSEVLYGEGSAFELLSHQLEARSAEEAEEREVLGGGED